MAPLIFPILVLSLAMWAGGLILNWIRTELHFRSGNAERMLVAVVDTAWVERKVLLPFAGLFSLSLAALWAFQVRGPSMLLTAVAVLLLVVVLIGATRTAAAKEIEILQRSKELEDPTVAHRERRFIYAVRAEAVAVAGVLVLVGLFLGS